MQTRPLGRAVAFPPVLTLAVLTLALLTALPALEAQETEESSTQLGAAWSYSGATAPQHWATLHPSFATCGAGTRQSPIDLTLPTRQELADPVLAYRMNPARLVGTHGIAVLRLDLGSAIEIDGYRYELLQIHAHAPSEHTVEGRSYPAELHLVHRHASGQLLVVGVLLAEAGENPDLEPLLPPWPAEGRTQELRSPLAPITLLPASLATYRYEGSLTTPPCDEGVRWLVLAQPLGASAAQLARLAAALHGNHRPVQPRHDRALVYDPSP